MKDLAVALEDVPGALASLGEALGRAGVSLEGGGAWAGVAHFLVEDGERARTAAEAAGFQVLGVREVVTARLRQAVPGQLGALCRRFASAGVNLEVQYSDHQHRLVLVVDDEARARAVVEAWGRDG